MDATSNPVQPASDEQIGAIEEKLRKVRQGGPGLGPDLIRAIFTYSNPMEAEDPQATIKLYADTRDFGLLFSMHVLDNIPGCAEKTLAIRAMQEAVMWANAATATQGGVGRYVREPSEGLRAEFELARETEPREESGLVQKEFPLDRVKGNDGTQCDPGPSSGSPSPVTGCPEPGPWRGEST